MLKMCWLISFVSSTRQPIIIKFGFLFSFSLVHISFLAETRFHTAPLKNLHKPWALEDISIWFLVISPPPWVWVSSLHGIIVVIVVLMMKLVMVVWLYELDVELESTWFSCCFFHLWTLVSDFLGDLVFVAIVVVVVVVVDIVVGLSLELAWDL